MVTSLCVSQDLRQGEKNRELSRQVLIKAMRIMMAKIIIMMIVIVIEIKNVNKNKPQDIAGTVFFFINYG